MTSPLTQSLTVRWKVLRTTPLPRARAMTSQTPTRLRTEIPTTRVLILPTARFLGPKLGATPADGPRQPPGKGLILGRRPRNGPRPPLRGNPPGDPDLHLTLDTTLGYTPRPRSQAPHPASTDSALDPDQSATKFSRHNTRLVGRPEFRQPLLDSCLDPSSGAAHG